MLLPDKAVGRGKERVPAILLSLWPCPLRPLLPNTSAPALNLATSNRKGQLLPPKHFRRGIERQSATYIIYFLAGSIDHPQECIFYNSCRYDISCRICIFMCEAHIQPRKRICHKTRVVFSGVVCLPHTKPRFINTYYHEWHC